MINNETIGISAEIAIADFFNVPVNSCYRSRGNNKIIDSIKPLVCEAFDYYDIDLPVKHVAEEQNPIDFFLENDKTLSVKTNQRFMGKVAPQIIGQPNSTTFFSKLYAITGYDVQSELRKNSLADTYENRTKLFKHFVFENTGTLLNIYWEHLFECDYLLYFYNILDNNRKLTEHPRYKVLSKIDYPNFDISHITFTQSEQSWNESCTMKYHGKAIGEFQVHNHRDCFKFRFNFKNLFDLI